MRDYTVAQLDFVLEMASLDEPDQYTFTRADRPHGRAEIPVAMTRWNDVLRGRLQQQYLERLGLGNAVRAVTEWRARQHQQTAGAGLRPGLSRNGKPVDADSPG